MSSDLIVACVNVGDYCGRGREYVRKLAAGVRRHLPTPYEFVCITDDLDDPILGVLHIAAEPRLFGWWSKMALFRPGVLPDGRILYFDLDTLIVGDIVHLANYSGPFAGLRNFYDPGFGSGLMAWDSSCGGSIWEGFEPMIDSRTFTETGDQEIIASLVPDACRIQDYVAGIYSYKVHCRDRGRPDDARVICFHGSPKPHEVNGWVEESWRD